MSQSNRVARSTLERELIPEEMLKNAQEVAQLTDFGDTGFLEPMNKLIEASIEEADLSEEGLKGFKGDIQRILVNKLRMQDDLVKHPEILDEDVSDPIIIVGVVRTGTTKLQRELAAAPGLQSIPLWQMLYLSRFPNEDSTGSAPRREYAIKHGFSGFFDTESTKAAHALEMDMVEEDSLLFEPGFEHESFYLRIRTPSYLHWINQRSPKPRFESYRKNLQYLQWQNGGRQGRVWNLKCTMHIGDLEALFKQFPDALVVHTHRDPGQSIPSYAKLQEMVWAGRGDPAGKAFVGKAMLDMWSDLTKRNMEARKRLAGQKQILDIPYRRVLQDSLSVIEEIYAAKGLELKPEAVASIKAWGEKNKQHKWGVHKYSGEEFGLSEENITEAFAEYLDAFNDYLY